MNEWAPPAESETLGGIPPEIRVFSSPQEGGDYKSRGSFCTQFVKDLLILDAFLRNRNQKLMLIHGVVYIELHSADRSRSNGPCLTSTDW